MLMSDYTKVITWILIFVTVMIIAPFRLTCGAEPSADDQQKTLITMDFYDVDITAFIKFISQLTGKKFVVDRNVKGTVNVISPSPLSREEAYKVFESVLEVHGYTTVPAGDIIKVVPLNQAKDKGLETMVGRTEASWQSTDKMVTRLIPLRFAEPVELQTLLTPLISKSGMIVAHSPTNTLIVTDVDSNILRLLQIIREIDVPDFSMKISILPLKNASAEELAKKLIELLEEPTKTDRSIGQGRPLGQTTTKRTKIIPFDRTNTLIILATLDDTQKIKMLVAQLDQPTPAGRDLIHVCYLKNGVAEDVCTVLGGLKKESEKNEKGGGKPVLSKDVSITPDKATNAIVVRATPEEYQTVLQVIQKLDIPRSMVYVEGLIVEATTEKAMRLGVEWNVGDSFNDGDAFWFGGANAGSSGSLGTIVSGVQTKDVPLGLPPGFALGVLGENITFGDVTFPTISALINAVATDSDFNILSTPQILTTDNMEAEVKVAQNIPFLTRVDLGTETTSRAIQSFEYKDVGVVLKVTPQINQDRYVRLTIEEEVKNVVQAQTQTSSGEPLLAPTTNVRSAKTTVIVKDGETVVLGGLIQDLRKGNEVRTPCIGELPIIGALFKTTSDGKSKTNLLVFLSPHIIENTEEARQLYLKKNHELQKLMQNQKTLQNNGQTAPDSKK
jgi:general secretion pathway protein D